MGFDLGGILKQYLGGGSAQPVGDPADHFHEVAQNAPPQVVRDGLSQAFRSDQTPPFGQMVGDLFRQANPQQQAGMLNQLRRRAFGPVPDFAFLTHVDPRLVRPPWLEVSSAIGPSLEWRRIWSPRRGYLRIGRPPDCLSEWSDGRQC